jgi:hypothetical protein
MRGSEPRAPAPGNVAIVPDAVLDSARPLAHVPPRMAEIGSEVLERVLRWCAEAGRPAAAAEVRAALAPLGWDELLAVQALLADPPPARPLGPHALADLARGTPADVAAEREREGRYGRADPAAGAEESALPAPEKAARGAARPRARGRAPTAFVIHRARDRAGPVDGGEADPRRPIAELLRPEGRSVLERLARRSGVARARLAAALGERYRTPEGPVSAEHVEALLREHGLARAFERRERDETLHAVRAAGGLLGGAAARVGLDRAGLDAAVARLGIAAEIERIREERRADLRGRATLGERARMLAREEDRLAELGLAAEFEADLRARLPEHLRALAASGEPPVAGLARTLSLPRDAVEALAARCQLDLSRPAPPRSRAAKTAPRSPPARPRGSGGTARVRAPRASPRPPPARPPAPPRPRPPGAGDRRGAARTRGDRAAGPRRGPRGGARRPR